MLDELAIAHEVPIRLGFFFTVFVVMALAEILSPRRTLTVRKSTRWLANLGLVGLNTVILRLALPAAAVAMAMFARERGFGLLNHFVLPSWMAFVVAVIILDLAMYLQHVVVHAVPLLWRLHRVHHADLDMDVTTGSAVSPHRGRALDAHQDRGRRIRGRTARSGRGVRGSPECDRDVQPR